jgi:hypothetical protein
MDTSAEKQWVANLDPRQNSNSSLWSSQHPIPLNHPLVPDQIRDAVTKSAKPNQLYRVTTLSIIEWWLMDLDGDLLNIFWMDGKRAAHSTSIRSSL